MTRLTAAPTLPAGTRTGSQANAAGVSDGVGGPGGLPTSAVV